MSEHWVDDLGPDVTMWDIVEEAERRVEAEGRPARTWKRPQPVEPETLKPRPVLVSRGDATGFVMAGVFKIAFLLVLALAFFTFTFGGDAAKSVGYGMGTALGEVPHLVGDFQKGREAGVRHP